MSATAEWRDLRKGFARISNVVRAQWYPWGWDLDGDPASVAEWRLLAASAARLANLAQGLDAWREWLKQIHQAILSDPHPLELTNYMTGDPEPVTCPSIADAGRQSAFLCCALATGLSLECAVGDSANAERRSDLKPNAQRIEDYQAEVLRRTGHKLTLLAIAQSAGYSDATELTRWRKHDPRATKTASQNFERLLREKPHLSSIPSRK